MRRDTLIEIYKKKYLSLSKANKNYYYPHPNDTIRYDNSYEKVLIKNAKSFEDILKKLESTASILTESITCHYRNRISINAITLGIGKVGFLEVPIVFILTGEKVLLFSTVNFASLIDKKNEDDFKLWNDVFEIELDIDEFEKSVTFNKGFNPYTVKFNNKIEITTHIGMLEYFIKECKNASDMKIQNNRNYYYKQLSEESIENLTKQSKNDDEDAQFVLGKILFKSGNVLEGLFWLKKSCDNYNEDAQKYLVELGNLGISDTYMYLYNFYNDNDEPTKAIFWLKKASDNGLSEAIYELGKRYYYGDGIRQSDDMTISLFSQLDDHFDISRILGAIYHEKKSFSNAAIHLEKAAKSGDSTCASLLSMYYYEGKGVEKSREKYYYWSSISKGKVCPYCGDTNYGFLSYHPKYKAKILDRIKRNKIDDDGFIEDLSKSMMKVKCNKCNGEWDPETWSK